MASRPRRRMIGALPRRVIVLAGAVVIAQIAPPTAVAGDYEPPAPRVVSGPSPLPAFGAPSGFCGSDSSHQDWEYEPALAANPSDDGNLVTAWTQDWADAIVVSYSTDRGKHWNTVVPRTTPCTGGIDFGLGTQSGFSTINASLSIGAPAGSADPRGVTYLAYNLSAPSNPNNPSRPYAEVVNRSLDGGKTWSAPVALERVDFPRAIDWSWVIADPARTGYAYAVWEVLDYAASTRHQHIAHSEDGGKTWSSSSQIPSVTLQAGGKLLAVPDGQTGSTLVDIVSEVPPQPAAAIGKLTGPTTLMARRSTDLGDTWSAPTQIALVDATKLAGASAALGPDGRTIYVAWMQGDPQQQTYTAMYSTSADYGTTWTQPRRIGPDIAKPLFAGFNNQLLLAPNLAIGADGTIAAMFYDHRSDPYNNPPNITDLWLRSSHDGGSTWTEEHLAGPFSLASAPERYIGGYQGLTPVGRGFAATFTLARPLAGAGYQLAYPPTDIFYEPLAAK